MPTLTIAQLRSALDVTRYHTPPLTPSALVFLRTEHGVVYSLTDVAVGEFEGDRALVLEGTAEIVR